MAREMPGGLLDYLKLGFAETHTTARLELEAMPGQPRFFYLATAGIEQDGVTYTARLSAEGATSVLRQSLGAATDRADVQIADADNGFLTLLGDYAPYLDGARIEIGRLWRNLDNGQKRHKVLMRGIVTGKAITDTRTALQVASEQYAVGTIGGGRIAARSCQWKPEFKGRKCGYTGAETTCNGLFDDAGGCSGRSNTHRFGGFVHIEGVNAIGGAAGNSPPQAAPTPANLPNTVYNVKLDYAATGNGTTDDTTAVQNAINAAQTAGSGTVWFPKGVYKVTGLTVTGNVTLAGFNDKETVIYSVTNAPIIATASDGNFEMPKLENLRIRGTVTAGSSQHGIKVDAATYGLRCVVRNVWIEDCGAAGLYVLKAFSSIFENVFATNCAGYPFLYDAANMPANVFRSCYAGNLRASATVGFRIKAGEFIAYNCNGVNSVPTGTKWAVVGKRNGVDGDATDAGALARFVDCNIESFDTHGILAYHSSTIIVDGRTVFAGNGNANQKGIEFDLAGDGTGYFAQLIPRGFIADTVNFADGVAAYLNSQPIHANGFAPIQVQNVGPATGGGVALSTFRNNTASATQKLARAGGSVSKLVVTGTTNINQPGVRSIECYLSAPGTITIPWGGWFDAQDALIVTDAAGNAATHNITLNVNAGGTINGLSTYVLDANRQGVILIPDGDTGGGHWRVIGTFQDMGFVDDRANGRVLSRRRLAATNGSVSSPGHTFESAYGAGMSLPDSRILALSAPVTVGSDGQEFIRLDGTGGSGARRSLFSSETIGALVDNTIDIGQSGNYRFRDGWFSRNLTAVGTMRGANAIFNSASTPLSTLEIVQPNASNYIVVRSHNAGGTDKGILFRCSNGSSESSQTAISANNAIFNLYGQGHDGTDYVTSAFVSMTVVSVASGDVRAVTQFFHRYGTGGFVEAMRTTASGVGVNTATLGAQFHATSASTTLLAAKFDAAAGSTVPAAEFNAPSGVAPVKFTNLNSNSTRTNGRTLALIVNTSGEMQAAAFGSQLFAATADGSVANTTSELTAIGTGSGTLTIDGGTVEVGDRFELELDGYHSSNGNAITLKFKIGSTTVCDYGSISLPGGITSQRFRVKITFTVRATGASGTVQAQMDSWFYNPGTGLEAIYPAVNTATTTIDWTANQTLNVTAQWSVANASNVLKVTNTTAKKWRI